MKLRIAELCKANGITIKELAEKLKITSVGLSQQINGNPRVETLEKIASMLNVPVWQLFSGSENGLNGFVEFHDKVHKIQSIEDMENLIRLVNNEKY